MNGSNSSDQCIRKRGTIMTEISQVEDSLKDSMYRVEVIERKLQTRSLTNESRERLEKELELVKEVLKKNQEQLVKLRKKNTESFAVTAAILFGIFLLYGLYSLWANSS